MNLLWFLRAPEGSQQENEHDAQPRLVLWGTLVVLIVFFGWASVAELDEVTRAQGSVIASARTQLIESQDGGVLETLLVREGDRVAAGQLLARIDRTRAEAAFLETEAAVAALMARKARLEAEVLGIPANFPSLVDKYPAQKQTQLRLMTRRETALREELDALATVRDLIAEELELNTPLLETGDISRTELLRLERQLAEVKAQMSNLDNRWFQDAQQELSETEAELAALQQQLNQRQHVLGQTELYAPMPGIVTDINITTSGGVVAPGEHVMEIVPVEDDLVVEARVSPRDIAFLQPGADATVKIDAYDYTVYGDLQGRLVFVSADTVQDDLREGETPYFRIRVQTEGRRFSKASERELDIQPGMTAMVEIKTGRRTVLQYLTKPVVKTLSESLGEH